MSTSAVDHSAWLHVHGGAARAAEAPVRRLRRAGLALNAGAGPDDEPFGVVFFDRVDEALDDLLRTRSRGGLARILAIELGARRVSPQVAWRLLDDGATDVLAWETELGDGAREVLERFERWEAVDALLESNVVRRNLVGKSPAWIRTLREVVEVARFTDASVLIQGESGTGKELLARLVHSLDPRDEKGDLVVLDCTTVVPELSGSEFFGHVRGSFTGAVAERKGAFDLADGGTLFLDEIGELPLGMQAQLLRVIQEGAYKPVGDTRWRKTRFRLVCATNRELEEEVARGRFRADLYFRLAGWVSYVPALRERSGDVLVLARHFLGELAPAADAVELDPAVCGYLEGREFAGNVRDLQRLVTRMYHHHPGARCITAGDVPLLERPTRMEPADDPVACLGGSVQRLLARGLGLKEIGRAAEEAALRVAIEETGTLKEAARRLGVTERAIQLRRAKNGGAAQVAGDRAADSP